MGQFDLKNYVLNVKVKENLTDIRAVERMKAWDFTMKEWESFEKEISPFHNPSAERIVRFFVDCTVYQQMQFSVQSQSKFLKKQNLGVSKFNFS